MPKQVIMGAILQCGFGAAPSKLIVLPTNQIMVCYLPAATIMDYMPATIIPRFGMCSAPANPAVIAAQRGHVRF
jgi:hypothetical protein